LGGLRTAFSEAAARANSLAANSLSATSSKGANRRRSPPSSFSAPTGRVVAAAAALSVVAVAGNGGVKGVGGGVNDEEESLKTESEEWGPTDSTALVVGVGSEEVIWAASLESPVSGLLTSSPDPKVKTGADAAAGSVLSAAAAPATSVCATRAACKSPDPLSEVDSPLKEIFLARSFTSCISSEAPSPAHAVATGVLKSV